MDIPLTNDDQIHRQLKLLTNEIEEYLDGFVLFGFTRGSNMPVRLGSVPTPKDAAALNKLIMDTIAMGGVRQRTEAT